MRRPRTITATHAANQQAPRAEIALSDVASMIR